MESLRSQTEGVPIKGDSAPLTRPSAHPNIVSMLKIVDDKDCTYVILEYCPEGDLFSNITERGLYVSDDIAIRRGISPNLGSRGALHNPWNIPPGSQA